MCRPTLLAAMLISIGLYGQRQSQNIKPASGDLFSTEPLLAWKFDTAGPIFGSPIISEGLVYAGSLDSMLYALNLSTGKLQWKFKTGGEIRSTVCLMDDTLFLFSGDATLYAIEKKTGKLLWKFKTLGGILGDRRHDFADYFQSSPICADNKIYFGAGDERVYSLDAISGKLIWSYKADGIVHTTPALYEDRIVVGSFDGYLHAINKNTGLLHWKFKTVGHQYFPDGEVQGSPVIANGLIYFGARDYNLYAVDAATGRAQWNKAFPFGWAMAVTPADSVVFVGTSDDRVFVALNARTGNELWRTNTKFNIFGPCVYNGSMAYVGTLMGMLLGIDLDNGKIKWQFTTEGYKKNRLRYFKEDDTFRDDIMTIIKTPADFIGMEYNLGAIFSTPALSGDRLVVTTTEASVYCLIPAKAIK